MMTKLLVMGSFCLAVAAPLCILTSLKYHPLRSRRVSDMVFCFNWPVTCLVFGEVETLANNGCIALPVAVFAQVGFGLLLIGLYIFLRIRENRSENA